MSGPDRRGRPARRRSAAVSVLAGLLVLALAPSAAQAHRMSKGTATKAARGAAVTVANALHGRTIEGGVIAVEAVAAGDCRRRSVHRFNCLMGHAGTAPSRMAW